jgi:methylated-DNA-protein-cysteine methyltransferase-like protein
MEAQARHRRRPRAAARRKHNAGRRGGQRAPAPRDASRAAALDDSAALQAIWHVVCSIPRGRAATYGAVARAAGFPGRARQTGYALRVAPLALKLPWHRVVGAGGRIVFAKSSHAHREQARRLRSEGVRVTDGRLEPGALTDLT